MSEPVTLAPESIDAVAHRVVELLLADNTPPRARLLDAAELADLLDVSRAYIYEHATELGAIRLGDGSRGRLRFDAEHARAALAARQHRLDPEPEPSRPRRRAQTTSTPLLPIRGQDSA